MNSSPTLGQRLRTVRELKKVTQQELELAIDASFGHVSRIESGKVNPSKETVLRIAEAMNLNHIEAMVLLGLNVDVVSHEEIVEAVRYTSQYFQKSLNPMYLLDDFWFVWSSNEVYMQIVGAPVDEVEKADYIRDKSGKNLLEWIFDPALPTRALIEESKWHEVALNHCICFIVQTDYYFRQHQNWVRQLLAMLNKLPDFKDLAAGFV